MKTSRQTARTLDLLRDYESRNVTFLAPDGRWPIVWDRARGCQVWDVDGREYLDLTAAFGVAAAGHANGAVVRAGRRQMGRLLHAMGDVHPHPLKAELARELSAWTFERWTDRGGGREPGRGRPSRGKVILGSSGFEAVEAALKTARIATGRSGVIAFEGAYHGVGYGTLNVTHRGHFKDSFRGQLREFGRFLPFPANDRELETMSDRAEALLRRGAIGAVLVEPMQARGGIRIPPPGFLPRLRALCDAHGALLILDEIYTGFGRTGRWFACEHTGVIPDLICLGKALTGGFPLSACVGRAALMDAWPASSGEAIHTSTFLGHPVGCAMALAQLSELRRLDLAARSAALGTHLLARLQALASGRAGVQSGKSPQRPQRPKSRKGARSGAGLRLEARGIGLMAGLELRDDRGRPATDVTLGLLPRLLERGHLFLPEGEPANVLAWTPPLTITRRQLDRSVEAVADALAGEPASSCLS